jgi:3-carboxy-cis,cis-muconate cycloisomerase
MTGSLFDSPLYGGLFPTGEVKRLFSDSAAIRAMLLVEGALAKVQGQAGLIPEISAAAIHRASLEVQIDPAALAQETAQNGVPVPALVAAFRTEMKAPEHAQYVHWGATSQDIMDSALMLRLRQVLVLLEQDMRAVLGALAGLAQDHARTVMAARTWGQHATPTSFGAVAASWGAPLLGLLEDLPALRDTALVVSLSGAAGTASALGASAPQQRAALAEALGLSDPGRSWHTDRTPVLAISGWITRVTVALAKMAEDVIASVQSETGELVLEAAGASSTMPQKQNPVAASAIVALLAQVNGANAVLHGAGVHRFQRDGAAWISEWMALPQLVLGGAAALRHGVAIAGGLRPDPARMRANLDSGAGLIFAETLSFALAQRMPRPQAQTETKALCKQVITGGGDLKTAALATYPELDGALFDPDQQLGTAPEEALAFAARVRAVMQDT